jgi:hypothetical protein
MTHTRRAPNDSEAHGSAPAGDPTGGDAAARDSAENGPGPVPAGGGEGPEAGSWQDQWQRDWDRDWEEDFDDQWDDVLGGLDEGRSSLWFLGEPAGLEEEREFDDDQWARDLETVPFVQRCRALHRFIGEGRRVTDSGVLPNAAVRELKRITGVSRPGGRLKEVPELLGPWNTLISFGSLVVDPDDKRVRSGPWPGTDSDRRPAERAREPHDGPDLGGVLALAEMLRSLSRTGPERGGFLNMDTALESLLAATCESGLTLPRAPSGLVLREIDVARLFLEIGANPRIHDLPLDEAAGLVDLDALADLADAQYDLDLLVAYGVLERQDGVLRAARPVRTGVALLLMLRA